MAKLIIEHESKPKQIFDISQAQTTIGRNEDNQICLKDNAVSARHCVIVKQGHSYYLKDLDSTNGTYINEKAVKEVKLVSGDKIIIGQITILFEKDKNEKGKGITTVIHQTSDEMRKGKSYATLMTEAIKEVKDHDLGKAVKKAEKSQKNIEEALHDFGWSDADADRIVSDVTGDAKDDFSPSLIISVDKPKDNERIIKVKQKLTNIETGNIIVFKGKNYLVLQIKETPEESFVTYRLKEC